MLFHSRHHTHPQYSSEEVGMKLIEEAPIGPSYAPCKVTHEIKVPRNQTAVQSTCPYLPTTFPAASAKAVRTQGRTGFISFLNPIEGVLCVEFMHTDGPIFRYGFISPSRCARALEEGGHTTIR